MNKKIRNAVYIIMGITAVVIIGLCIWNICNNKDFFKFNVFNGITMLWTVGLSFIVTQSFSRYQRKADIILRIIQDLITNISEPNTCNIYADTKKEEILMRNRQIKQQITLLAKNAQKFGIKKEVKFVKSKFMEYESFVSEHIADMNYLSKSRTTLTRPIKLIYNKLYEIMLKL